MMDKRRVCLEDKEVETGEHKPWEEMRGENDNCVCERGKRMIVVKINQEC